MERFLKTEEGKNYNSAGILGNINAKNIDIVVHHIQHVVNLPSDEERRIFFSAYLKKHGATLNSELGEAIAPYISEEINTLGNIFSIFSRQKGMNGYEPVVTKGDSLIDLRKELTDRLSTLYETDAISFLPPKFGENNVHDISRLMYEIEDVWNKKNMVIDDEKEFLDKLRDEINARWGRHFFPNTQEVRQVLKTIKSYKANTELINYRKLIEEYAKIE